MSAPVATVAAVLAFAQVPHVTRRSLAYMEGVKAKLQFKLEGIPFPRSVYAEGTAEFDAFYAGAEHGTGYLEHWVRVGGVRP